MLLCRRLRKEAPGTRPLVVVILSTLTPKVTGQDGTQLQVEPFVRGCRREQPNRTGELHP